MRCSFDYAFDYYTGVSVMASLIILAPLYLADFAQSRFPCPLPTIDWDLLHPCRTYFLLARLARLVIAIHVKEGTGQGDTVESALQAQPTPLGIPQPICTICQAGWRRKDAISSRALPFSSSRTCIADQGKLSPDDRNALGFPSGRDPRRVIAKDPSFGGMSARTKKNRNLNEALMDFHFRKRARKRRRPTTRQAGMNTSDRHTLPDTRALTLCSPVDQFHPFMEPNKLVTRLQLHSEDIEPDQHLISKSERVEYDNAPYHNSSPAHYGRIMQADERQRLVLHVAWRRHHQVPRDMNFGGEQTGRRECSDNETWPQRPTIFGTRTWRRKRPQL
ncbi:hypothetical protein K449DRAFT_460798 [Hypoxylon sp. EC38]|nr:hypothetical protein K449DRAFT_460798 [Hypoxylon sp. EC38]